MSKPIWSSVCDVVTTGNMTAVIGGPLVVPAGASIASDTGHTCLKSPTGVSGTLPIVLTPAATGYSCSFWFKALAAPTDGSTLFQLVNLAGGDWFVQLPLASGITYLYTDAANIISLGSPTLTAWHHYAMSSAKAGTMEAYLDGVLKGSIPVTQWFADSVSSLDYSNKPGSSFGEVDDLRIYNTPITQADVNYDFTSNASLDNLRPVGGGPVLTPGSTVSDGMHNKLGGTTDLTKSNMDLLNASLAGDIQKYGYGYAIIKNWGTLGVDSVMSARGKHAADTQFETVQDAEARYWRS